MIFDSFSHISCVLKQGGTWCSSHYFFLTASSHISCVLKWSGTYINKIGSLRTSSLNSSCVPGIYFSIYNKTAHVPSIVYQKTFLNELIILFIPLGLSEDVVMVTAYKGASKSFLYAVIRYKKSFMFMTIIFLFLFFHLLDAKQLVKSSSFIEAF